MIPTRPVAAAAPAAGLAKQVAAPKEAGALAVLRGTAASGVRNPADGTTTLTAVEDTRVRKVLASRRQTDRFINTPGFANEARRKIETRDPDGASDPMYAGFLF